MGGDGQMLSGRVELVLDDSQRWSTRVVYAKVNPLSQSISRRSIRYAEGHSGRLGLHLPVSG